MTENPEIVPLSDEEAHELSNRLSYPIALLDSRVVYEIVVGFHLEREETDGDSA